LIRSLRSRVITLLSCLTSFALFSPSTFAAQAQKPSDDNHDGKEIFAYALSMDTIRHLADATKQLKDWEQKNPDAAKGMAADELKNASSIAEQAKLFDAKFPQGAAILKKSGFSTKEYLVALYAFIQAAMIVSLKKAGQASDSAQLDGVVNPANIDLLERNWDET
jgi:hypothetical protein